MFYPPTLAACWMGKGGENLPLSLLTPQKWGGGGVGGGTRAAFHDPPPFPPPLQLLFGSWCYPLPPPPSTEAQANQLFGILRADERV